MAQLSRGKSPTPEAFERDPRLVWEWYNWRRELIATEQRILPTSPLLKFERRTHDMFWLITQNVDGLHRTAGSQRLSEIHGNIWKVGPGCGVISENLEIPLPILPTCRLCHSLRPHIVWFGESLWEEDLRRCDQAIRVCDLFLVIGTWELSILQQDLRLWRKMWARWSSRSISRAPRRPTWLIFALQGRARDLVPLLL